ncbi:hypothetical protein V2J09_005669 [Rumex salicifolius]
MKELLNLRSSAAQHFSSTAQALVTIYPPTSLPITPILSPLQTTGESLPDFAQTRAFSIGDSGTTLFSSNPFLYPLHKTEERRRVVTIYPPTSLPTTPILSPLQTTGESLADFAQTRAPSISDSGTTPAWTATRARLPETTYCRRPSLYPLEVERSTSDDLDSTLFASDSSSLQWAIGVWFHIPDYGSPIRVWIPSLPFYRAPDRCILFHTAYSDPEYSWMTHVDRATLGHDFSAFKKLPLHVVYSTSFYFAYATVSTVGYGDIHPHTPYEMYIVFTITLFTALVAIISSRMMGSLLDLHGVYQRAEDSRAVRRARALRVRKALQTAQEAVRDQSTQRDLRLKVATTAEVYRDAQIDLARSVAQASQRVRHADDVFQASEAGLSSQIDLEVQAVRQEMQAQADHVDQMAHEVHVAQAAQTAHATDSILRALQALAELETQECVELEEASMGGEEERENQRLDDHELDEDVAGRPRGVLEWVYGVPYWCRIV